MDSSKSCSVPDCEERYRWRHLVGIGIGVAGLFSAVYADLRDGPRSQQPHAVLGDMICLVGACLYAVSNTVQERLAKRIGQADLRELVGMLGCFGAILNGVQAFIFEREAFAAIPWSPEVVFAFVGYVACLFTMYTLTPHLLQRADATVFNLSLLTSDAYAVFFDYLLGRNRLLDGWFVLALLCSWAGLALYTLQPVPTRTMMAGRSRLLEDSTPRTRGGSWEANLKVPPADGELRLSPGADADPGERPAARPAGRRSCDG